jgi:hypothetical protein
MASRRDSGRGASEASLGWLRRRRREKPGEGAEDRTAAGEEEPGDLASPRLLAERPSGKRGERELVRLLQQILRRRRRRLSWTGGACPLRRSTTSSRPWRRGPSSFPPKRAGTTRCEKSRTPRGSASRLPWTASSTLTGWKRGRPCETTALP